MAGLDADAPEDNEEYIFNGRPSNQPTITQKLLNKWYMDLVKEAVDQHVVDVVKYDERKDSKVSFILSKMLMLSAWFVFKQVLTCLNYSD